MLAKTQIEHRMLEPIARALIRKLLVPKVYFGAKWLGFEADVLAIDRAGTGDVHVVQVKAASRTALTSQNIDRLIQVRAHYLWLAFPRPSRSLDLSDAPLYLIDGPGRIGIIETVEMGGATIGANIVLPGERFIESLHQEVRQFISTTEADISFG